MDWRLSRKEPESLSGLFFGEINFKMYITLKVEGGEEFFQLRPLCCDHVITDNNTANRVSLPAIRICYSRVYVFRAQF